MHAAAAKILPRPIAIPRRRVSTGWACPRLQATTAFDAGEASTEVPNTDRLIAPIARITWPSMNAANAQQGMRKTLPPNRTDR